MGFNTQTISSGTIDVSSNNKELLSNIGRRLREAPELSATEPLSHAIKRHLELLKGAEMRENRQSETDDPDSADKQMTAE